MNEHTEPANYTHDELDEFRALVRMNESLNQMERIHARLEMPEFVKRVGKQRCDIMFEVLKQEMDNE